MLFHDIDIFHYIRCIINRNMWVKKEEWERRVRCAEAQLKTSHLHISYQSVTFLSERVITCLWIGRNGAFQKQFLWISASNKSYFNVSSFRHLRCLEPYESIGIVWKLKTNNWVISWQIMIPRDDNPKVLNSTRQGRSCTHRQDDVTGSVYACRFKELAIWSRT